MTTEERLEELLALKDEKIAALEEELSQARRENQELEGTVENSLSGWSLPGPIPDDHPELPVPRLELVYKVTGHNDYYTKHEITYRLVRRHLEDHLEEHPFHRTRCDGASRAKPWLDEHHGPVNLPFRAGAQIAHDAANLQLPAYAITPDGVIPLTEQLLKGHPYQTKLGAERRVTDQRGT